MSPIFLMPTCRIVPFIGVLLVAGVLRADVDLAPTPLDPSLLTLSTKSRSPQLVGVPELITAPGNLPKYYRTLTFSGERHYATAPINGIPDVCAGILGSQSITPTKSRSKLQGQIAYQYNEASDSGSFVNGTQNLTASNNEIAWKAAICSPPPSPLPLGLGLPSTGSPINYGEWYISANNPLGLPVTSPTVAFESTSGYLDYIGDGRNYYPNWYSNAWRMVLSDEDTPQVAEARAKVTTVADQRNRSLSSSILGSRAGGTRWTIRESKVKVRFAAGCSGDYTLYFNYKKGPWVENQITVFGPVYEGTRFTVTLKAGDLFEREFALPQELGEEIVLDSVEYLRPEGCGSGACFIGGPAGGGSGPNQGSIHWYLPLGQAGDGRSAGALTLHKTRIDSSIYTLAALKPALPQGFDPSTLKLDGAGNPRQILVPQALVDFVITGLQSYEVRFYDRSSIGAPDSNGIYTPAGTAYTTWKVANPDASGVTANRLRVTRVIGSENLVTDIDESQPGKRVFSEANGLKITETTETTENGDRVESIVVKNQAGEVASKRKIYYRTLGGREEWVKEVLDPDGAAVTTLQTFEPSPNSSIYRIKNRTRPDGFVENYQYDGNGQLTTTAIPAWTNTQQATNTSSEYVDLNADGELDRLERVATEVGLSTLRLDYTVDWGGTVNGYKRRDSYRAITGGKAWNDPSNIVTRERFDASGKLLYRLNPDGILMLRSSTVNGEGTTTVIEKQGASDPTKESVVDGTITTEIYTAKGALRSTTVSDIASGRVVQSLVTAEFDPFDRPTRLLHIDGAVEVRDYCTACGQVVAQSLRGQTTSSVFDDLRRKIEETASAGSTVLSKTRFRYDAEGRLVQRLRVDPQSGVETVLTTTVYDPAGRVLSETTLGQGTTSYSYAFGAANTTVTTTTYHDSGTRIETRAASGEVVSIRGTAVAPVDHVFSTREWWGGGNGYIHDVNRLNADNSFIQVKQSINTLGDVEYTELGSTSIRTVRYFDAIGRLVKETDPDGVATLYAYDANGRQSITAIDMNRNGVIDYTGGDRITRTLSEVGVRDGFTVQRTTTQVWETPNQDTPNSISVSESSVDGLRTWQTVRGQTSSSVIAYDGQGGRTVTSIGLGNLKMVQSYLGNRLLSTVTTTADNTQITATTNAYDSSGKLATTTDARNGATSFNYDSQDRLLSVITPDPDPTRSGPGYDPQAISYTYDAMGRMTAVTQPDGGVVNTTYWPTGSVKRTWGTRTYPVEYTYDVQGQLKTLTTWQNFAGDAGKAVTIWNYDSPLGRLVNKRYPDNTGPSYTYTAAGRMSTRSWARTPAVSVTYTLNNAGEVSFVNYSDATPDVTMTYDRLGRASSVADGAGTRTFAYHASGQLQNENYTAGLLDGTGVTRTFDTLDRLASVSANAATTLVSTAYGYDPASRLKSVTTGADTATYAYAANSNLVATLTLARSGSTRVVTARTYDALNRLASIVNDLNAASANLRHGYTYNAANQRTRATREDNSYWSYAYDNLGQVVTGSKYRADDVATPGHAFNWTYDDIGNRKTAVQNGQTTNYTSSLLNSYVQATVPAVADVMGAAAPDATVTVTAVPGAAAPLATTRQDELFYRQIPVPNTEVGVRAEITLNAVKPAAGAGGGDLVAVTKRSAYVAKTPEVFTHDLDGNLQADARWNYTWDAENRLVGLATSTPARAAGVPRTQLTMVYDSQGRRVQKSVTKSDVAGLVNVRRDYFTNDSLSGAIASTVFGGNVDDSWFRGQGLPYPGSFSYRATAELRVPATGQWTLEVTTFEGGARLYVNNVLVVDTWNAGATTPVTLALAAGTAHTLRYEYRYIPGVIGGTTPISRLSWSGPGQSLQSVPNAADTTGPAVTTTTRYLYDGWNLLAEISSAGSAVRTYAWGLDLSGSAQGAGGVGGLISVTDSVGGTAHFAAYDGNGNVSGLVRADDGSLSAKYDYNAFGETILAEGAFASGNPFRFSTKFTDDDSGLLYYGFRYYNPNTGRWPSRDPLEEQGGANLYVFCYNDGVGMFDPDGRLALSDIIRSSRGSHSLTVPFGFVNLTGTVAWTESRQGECCVDVTVTLEASWSPQRLIQAQLSYMGGQTGNRIARALPTIEVGIGAEGYFTYCFPDTLNGDPNIKVYGFGQGSVGAGGSHNSWKPRPPYEDWGHNPPQSNGLWGQFRLEIGGFIDVRTFTPHDPSAWFSLSGGYRFKQYTWEYNQRWQIYP